MNLHSGKELLQDAILATAEYQEMRDIYEMMKAKGQDELIDQYNMAPFTIQVLSKLRTFCEKISFAPASHFYPKSFRDFASLYLAHLLNHTSQP